MRNHALTIASIIALTLSAPSHAESCYASIQPAFSSPLQAHTLYILVDQTAPLTPVMQQNIQSLVAGWPRQNERVKIIRFSATLAGEFTETVLDTYREAAADEEYLYNLRDQDKSNLLNCLSRQQNESGSSVNRTLEKLWVTLKPQLGKADILAPLKRIAESAVRQDPSSNKTILVISSGFEKSDIADFTKRKRKGDVDPVTTLKRLEDKNLLTDWQGANIYMYGLGLPKDRKSYVRNAVVTPLRQFWQIYFEASKGRVKELGAPAILSDDLRN